MMTSIVKLLKYHIISTGIHEWQSRLVYSDGCIKFSPSLSQGMSSRLWLPVSAKYALSISVDPEDARSSSKVYKVPELLPHHLG